MSDLELTHLTSMSSTRSDVSDRNDILYSDLYVNENSVKFNLDTSKYRRCIVISAWCRNIGLVSLYRLGVVISTKFDSKSMKSYKIII